MRQYPYPSQGIDCARSEPEQGWVDLVPRGTGKRSGSRAVRKTPSPSPRRAAARCLGLSRRSEKGEISFSSAAHHAACIIHCCVKKMERTKLITDFRSLFALSYRRMSGAVESATISNIVLTFCCPRLRSMAARRSSWNSWFRLLCSWVPDFRVRMAWKPSVTQSPARRMVPGLSFTWGGGEL